MKKVRFSLLGILTLTAFVGLLLTLVFQTFKIQKIESENKELKVLSGHIHVAHQGDLHVRRLECNVPNAWRFRVHVPENERKCLYMGYYQGGDIECANFQPYNGIDLPSGQYVLTFWLSRDRGAFAAARLSLACDFANSGQVERESIWLSDVAFSKLVADLGDPSYEFENFSKESSDPHGPLVVKSGKNSMVPLSLFPKDAGTKFPVASGETKAVSIWIGPRQPLSNEEANNPYGEWPLPKSKFHYR